MNRHRVGKMGKIRDDDALVADLAGELAHLLMRALEEIVEDTELVHDLERRGMDGVAAEVAQEIGMLLQHHDIDTGAGEQKRRASCRPGRRRRWRIGW